VPILRGNYLSPNFGCIWSLKSGQKRRERLLPWPRVGIGYVSLELNSVSEHNRRLSEPIFQFRKTFRNAYPQLFVVVQLQTAWFPLGASYRSVRTQNCIWGDYQVGVVRGQRRWGEGCLLIGT
jgi:hypothetical protein